MSTSVVLFVSQATGAPWWVVPLGAAATVLSAAITGAVALLVLRLNNQAAEKRLEFERVMKLRDDRREAYAKMLRVTKVLEATPPGPGKDVAEAHAEIEILTAKDAIINIAGELVRAVGAARQAAWESEQSKAEDPYQEPRFVAAKQRVEMNRASFILLARDDLDYKSESGASGGAAQKDSGEAASENSGTEDTQQPARRSWWRRFLGGE